MRDLVNMIGKYKHELPQEQLDELMITYLYNYGNSKPNDFDLGETLRKEVLELHKIFLEIKAIRDKTVILD
jgi:hypothetical protein